CIIVIVHFVVLAWTFFWAASVVQATDVLARIGAMKFEMSNLLSPVFSIPMGAAKLPVSVLLVLILSYLAHWFPKNALDKLRDGFTWLPSPVQAALILTIALSLFYISGTEVQLIYGNF